MLVLKKHWLLALGITFVFCVFCLVYLPTLFNFFIYDDFFYIAWLERAIHHPELLLAKYWEPWSEYGTRIAQSEAPLFYRPFFNTMIFMEYSLWKSNGVCFRLVNMVVEFLTGIQLGFVLVAISETRLLPSHIFRRQSIIWAFLTGALFILFPLHSEPVNWISARMDPLVTLFSLFSLWCHIKWRNSSKRKFFVFSIIATVLAFLTKEMAVTIPPTILLYELLFGNIAKTNTVGSIQSFSYLAKLRYSIIATWPYWLILFLYFCLRYALLGDPIAGYRIDFLETFSLNGWLQGLKAIFVPINTLIIVSRSYIFKGWLVALFTAITLTILAFYKMGKYGTKIMVFLIVWFLLCLAPVYKIFPLIMSTASGSRLAYMATAPICALLTFGMSMLFTNNNLIALVSPISLILLSLAASILYSNNLAWAQAGHLTNKIIQGFKEYYQNIDGDPLVYVCGLPEFTDKGINTIVSLPCGMMSKPFMERDLHHCVEIKSHDEYNSIEFIKNSLLQKQKK